MNVSDTTSSRALLEESEWLHALARRLVRDPALAGDAAQQALLSATHASAPSAPAKRRRWLSSVLRNFVRQAHRSRTRRADHEERVEAPSEASSSYEVVARLELRRRVVDAVEALEEPYRTTIALRFLEGLSPREVARRMDVPVKTVHTRVDRALVRLRGKLDDAYDGRPAWIAALLPFADAPRLAGPAGVGIAVMGTIGKTVGAAAGVVILGVLVQRGLAPDAGEPQHPVSAAVPSAGLEKPRETANAPVSAVPAVEPESRRAATVPPASTLAADPVAPRYRGRVVDIDDHPVANVRVVFEPTSDVERELTTEETQATSDSDGGFELVHTDRRGRLVVSDRGLATVIAPGVAGMPPVPPVVVVAPARSYTGIVVDPDGAPLVDVELRVELGDDVARRFRPGGFALAVPVATSTTDADGAFRFESIGFAAGSRLIATHRGFESGALELPSTSATGLVLELTPIEVSDRTVAGIVVDAAGQPIEGAALSLGSMITRSSADGAFVLELFGDETTDVLRGVSTGYLPAERSLAALGPDERHAVVLTLGERARTIAGVVVDAGGEPVEGAQVWTWDGAEFGFLRRGVGELTFLISVTVEEMILGGEADGREATTDADGRFELDGLVERDYALFAWNPVTLQSERFGAVRAGDRGVVLRLTGSDPVARVAGRVVTSSNEPVTTALIRVSRRIRTADGRRMFRGAPMEFGARTDAQGRFAFDALAVDGTSLLLNGEGVPSAQRCALTDAPDLEDIVFVVPSICHLRVFLDSNRDEANVFSIEDADGNKLNLSFMRGSVTLGAEAIALEDGESPLTQTDDSARFLVLYRGEEEVSRVPLELVAGEVNEIRL